MCMNHYELNINESSRYGEQPVAIRKSLVITSAVSVLSPTLSSVKMLKIIYLQMVEHQEL